MIPRRQLLETTGVAGLMGALFPPAAPAAAEQAPHDRAIADVASAIADLRRQIAADRAFPELTLVREQQRNFIRATGKYPDFIEVGVDVWQGIYDWHVRWQQPITIARDANNRYVMSLVATTIVLRPDTVPNYVGAPYDSK